jgi:pimeloyl-ACP methyl ester carboxylesterase
VFSQRTRHIAFAVAGLITFIVLAGVTYQSVSNAFERRRFRHPGRLIDVGGHQLHIYCVGEGAPTVVLEAPAGGVSVAWAWVQDDLAKTTRVCSYDRAGLGWSETGERGYRPAGVPQELHALLEGAGERGPFVMTGHELGAAFARMYAAQYRADTAALVLVDELSDKTLPAGRSRLVQFWPWLARVGLLRVTRALSRHAAGLPEAAGGSVRAFLNRPDHLTRAAMEIARRTEAVDLAGTSIDGTLPFAGVVTTTADEAPPVLLDSADGAREVTRALEEAIRRVRRETTRPSPAR